MPHHLTAQQLEAGLPEIQSAPADGGHLRAIVVRPDTNQRQSLQDCTLSPEGGVHGDNWSKGCWKTLPDGSPHPDVQVAIINSRTIQLIAGSEDLWPLAGDNLYVDLDLSADNLPVGERLSIGSVVLEITSEPHLGCGKFRERYGADALQFVNSDAGCQLRLRGVYAKVVQAGSLSVGDACKKISAS